MGTVWELCFTKPLLFSIQMKEQEIRRQFRAAVNIQNKQYKILKEQLLTRTSKADQKAMLAKLKEEQDRRLSMLSDQYEQSISEVKQHQHVSEKKWTVL